MPDRQVEIIVREGGSLTTIQDEGRVGYASLGVPRAGGLDEPAAALANRLVGNPVGAAVLEVTFGGLVLSPPPVPRWVAVTGANAEVTTGHQARPWSEAFPWHDGPLRIDAPRHGMRTYVAIGGGIDVAPVLGSRSTDVLAGIGPAPLRPGDRLPLGSVLSEPAPVDVPEVRRASGLRVAPGPRAEWFAGDVLAELHQRPWTVRAESNRIGLRLDGAPLVRATEYASAELPSEGMVLGAVQVPPDGQPVVFLHDHPTTGGYPVVAVVDRADLWQCAQARPGDEIRFRRATTG